MILRVYHQYNKLISSIILLSSHLVEVGRGLSLLLFLSLFCVHSYAKVPVTTLFDLPPFERAICCIKYYEGMHRAKDYPYVGYGHKLRPGEHYSSNMSRTEAELLLRSDLERLCDMFSEYGRDSLVLATLAYNVGPYRLLGSKGHYPKSTLVKKLEAGIRDIKRDYTSFCHWKGKRMPSIERRRYAELLLLYER